MKTCGLTALVMVLGLAGTAGAGEIADKAVEAEAALGAGEGARAVALMREALVEAWSQAPLAVAKAVFVTEPAAGYGVYAERSDMVFAPEEPLRIYLEPVGFEWRREGEVFTSLLTVDFDLTTPDGQVLAGQKGFGRFAFESHVPNTEYMSDLTLTVSGAPADDYILVLTVNDETGGGSASVEMPFRIE